MPDRDAKTCATEAKASNVGRHAHLGMGNIGSPICCHELRFLRSTSGWCVAYTPPQFSTIITIL